MRQVVLHKKRTFKAWNTLYVLAVSCLLNSIVWFCFHGFPVSGLPNKEDVRSVTISCITLDSIDVREISDKENIELLVNAANLLNYKIFSKKESEPGDLFVSVVYRLKNGESIIIETDGNTMWQNGNALALNEPYKFINIIQELYF
ncbi:hypothetical protein IMSAG049_00302 [Clostridiales bacterium]|nr:hypothetical protein IMSAG049_00302 [Clostridiales bacterium]